MRVISVCIAMIAALLLLGCPKPQQRQQAAAPAKNAAGLPLYPVMRSTRKYIKVNENVDKAWGFVEDAYAVILQKWDDSETLLKSNDPAERQKGTALRNQVNDEIQTSIFTVNPKVEDLFKEAIKEEPDNPLNYAAYAYYLKPRKRPVEGSMPVDTEEEAVEQIDKAIKLWPDESSFYLVKTDIITSAQICHEWVRSRPMEGELIAQRMDIVRDLLNKAEQYDPDNAFIDYYSAIMEAHYGDQQFRPGSEKEMVPFSEIRDRVMREIRSGNKKKDNRFFFPPPLQPYNKTARNQKLNTDSMEPAYVDQWNQFGHWDTMLVDTLMTKMTDGWTWDNNKQDMGQLLLMLYKLGQTEPYDRSFFGLVLKYMQPFQEQTKQGSPERLAFADAMRNLDSHYMELTNLLIQQRMVKDAKTVGVMAVHEAELNFTRNTTLKDYSQGHFAAWLKYANKKLDLGLDLADDPEQW